MEEKLPMDPLHHLTKKELFHFFRCKKTEMSCMECPNTFLHQLRDRNLVPEKLYKRVINMKSKERKKDGVYQILDWLEKEKGHSVLHFWKCVFEDHILQQYPVLRLLKNNLLDGSFRLCENLSDTEDETEREKEPGKSQETPVKEKKKAKKRKKNIDETEDDEEPGPSVPSTPNQKKPSKKLNFSSPGKKGEKLDIWTWPLYKKRLPVTCGGKKGTLYRDKLAKGELCIYSQSQWFSPSEFENFGGKGRNKNWKYSIRCRDTTLQKLIEGGHLENPRQKRRCVKKNLTVKFPDISPESSSSRSSGETEGSVEEYLDDQNRMRAEDGEAEEEGEKEDEEAESVDPSVFKTPSLPVSCGSFNGYLHKYRFVSGSRGKSIRTEERWFTPEEFVRQETTLTDGHWKKDIRCYDKTLNYLLEKKVVGIHSLLCVCRFCSAEDQDQRDQDNDDKCFICDTEGDLVCCDECPRAFHYHCHLPPIQDDMLGDTWICTFCVLKTNQRCWHMKHMTEEEALKCSISQHTLHCQYLLLWMCKKDIGKVFTEDPRNTVSDYSRVISKPMWMNRVKEKLQNKEYKTLGQFVSDIRLIFHNCHIFNRGNELDNLGSRLKEMFDREIKTIFNIQ